MRSRYSSCVKSFGFSVLPSTAIHRRYTQRSARFRLGLCREFAQDLHAPCGPWPSSRRAASRFVRSLPKSRGTGDRRAGTPTAARGVCPETPQTEAISVRPSFRGRALAPLATLEEPSCRRSPGNRSPLAPQRVSLLLEVDLHARTWTTSDLGRNEGPHRRGWLPRMAGGRGRSRLS